MNAAYERGIVSTLEGGLLAQSKDVGFGTGSQIRYTDSTPIPVVTGLTLLFLRPYPWEAPHIIAILAGAEVLVLTSIMIVSWLSLSNWRKHMFRPLMFTSILVTLFLAFFFSYLFNMGLVVRQRIQFFPALIALAATPSLIKRSPAYAVAGRSVRPGYPANLRITVLMAQHASFRIRFVVRRLESVISCLYPIQSAVNMISIELVRSRCSLSC